MQIEAQRAVRRIGEDGKEHYDVIDMQIEAKRAVRRITDPKEIAMQYQKVVRAYNILCRIIPGREEEE